MQTETLTFQQVKDFPYPLNVIEADKIFSAIDINTVNPMFIEDVKSLQEKIERPVFIMDGINEHALKHGQALINKYPNILIIALPNIEHCVLNQFGDTTLFKYVFNDYHILQNLVNQPVAIHNNLNSLKDSKNEGYYIEDCNNIATKGYNLYGESNGIGRTKQIVAFNKNYIEFRFPIVHRDTDNQYKLVVRNEIFPIMTSFYECNKDLFNMTKEEYAIKQKANFLIQFIGNMFTERKRNIKREISANNQTIREIYQRIYKLETEIGEKSAYLRSLATKDARQIRDFYNPENVTNILKNLISKGQYTDIRFNYPTIVADTDDIYVESHGKKYLIGQFEIRIDMTNRVILFYNTTNNQEIEEDTSYQHPHISNHNACFGNFKEHINKQLMDNDIPTLLQTLMTFLKEYNDGRYGGAPYVLVERYWGDEDDWNEDYQLPTRDPRCIERIRREGQRRHPNFTVNGNDECSECGSTIHDCVDDDNCNRNPETGEFNE